MCVCVCVIEEALKWRKKKEKRIQIHVAAPSGIIIGSWCYRIN